MLMNFEADLVRGHKAEQVAIEGLAALTNHYTFENVANQKEYYYKGDIIATDKRSGK